MPRLTSRAVLLIALAPAIAGCSSAGTDTAALAPSGLSLPNLPTLNSNAVAAPPSIEAPVGSPTEIYSRVAQGAVGCWFGTKGPLKKEYIYHAEADAPSRGGKAEITIHVRDMTQPNPRGAKAYKVKIEPKDETATVATENLKMPEAFATAMTADVGRWAHGDTGCATTSTAASWGAPAIADGATPPPPAAAQKKKSSKKTASAAHKPAAADKAQPKP